jgi:hypothetical protein
MCVCDNLIILAEKITFGLLFHNQKKIRRHSDVSFVDDRSATIGNRVSATCHFISSLLNSIAVNFPLSKGKHLNFI